jgi:hypothetical protein
MINDRIVSTIFLIGFIVGSVFNFSGILSFSCGFTTGIIFVKTYWKEPINYENINYPINYENINQSSINWIKKIISMFVPENKK